MRKCEGMFVPVYESEDRFRISWTEYTHAQRARKKSATYVANVTRKM
jgi:hypothetical protein